MTARKNQVKGMVISMRKITRVIGSVLILLSLLSVTACGKEDKNAVAVGELKVSLQKVEANEKIGLMRRTFTVTGDAKQAQELFAPTLAESSQEGEKTVITEIAFYNAPEELWKLSCNLAGEGAEYTLPEIQVDAIVDKEFEVSTAKGETAKVILTPYAAWIQSNGAWMQKEDAYQFAAVFADGEEEEIAVLPVSRSKKAREKELRELPFFGEGYRIGQELLDENGEAAGGKFIFWEEEALDAVDSVCIYE